MPGDKYYPPGPVGRLIDYLRRDDGVVDVADRGLPLPKRIPPTPPVKPPRMPPGERKVKMVDPDVFRVWLEVEEGKMTFEQAFFRLMNELFLTMKGRQ